MNESREMYVGRWWDMPPSSEGVHAKPGMLIPALPTNQNSGRWVLTLSMFQPMLRVNGQ